MRVHSIGAEGHPDCFAEESAEEHAGFSAVGNAGVEDSALPPKRPPEPLRPMKRTPKAFLRAEWCQRVAGAGPSCWPTIGPRGRGRGRRRPAGP
jgi:hypothetical protein